jgi:hypothetical protein
MSSTIHEIHSCNTQALWTVVHPFHCHFCCTSQFPVLCHGSGSPSWKQRPQSWDNFTMSNLHSREDGWPDYLTRPSSELTPVKIADRNKAEILLLHYILLMLILYRYLLRYWATTQEQIRVGIAPRKTNSEIHYFLESQPESFSEFQNSLPIETHCDSEGFTSYAAYSTQHQHLHPKSNRSTVRKMACIPEDRRV